MASVIVTQEQAFLGAVAGLGAALADAQLDQFRAYHRELIEWNQRANLTTITDYSDVLTRHFLDSLTAVPLLRETRSLIDIGTGAGFPGIPLAIACPDLQVTVVDSVGKKTAFCAHVASRLGLTNVSALTGRAEDLGQDPVHRERYDVAVSRAVDRLATLAEYLLPLCRVRGQAIVMKKGNLHQELLEAGAAVAELGGATPKVLPITVPGLTDGRALVTVQKRSPTPARYPRRSGMPRKRPL